MRGSTSPKHRRRPGRRYRRWPRRVLVAVNVVVALGVIAAGSVYGYVRYTIASIRTLPAPSATRPQYHSPEAYHGLPPENILLIGNQSRAGTNNPAYGQGAQYSASLSDVIMILHLDPRTRQASILSIPRDLFVPMPAGSPVGSWGKINAALNDGIKGPDNLIKAIHQDFGIPINHFVEIDFNGFLKTIDALGGVRLDFPERLYDGTSDLGIYHTGCQLIRGALVRSRHLQYDPPGVSPAYPPAWPADPESDLSRIVRDHVFLKVLLTTAEHEGLSSPFRANAFISALIDQVTMDPGMKGQLIALAARFGHLAPGSLLETTIPVSVGGALNGYYYGGYGYGDVEFPTQPADDRAVNAWDPGVFAGAVKPSRVVVDDATGTGTAAVTAAALTRDGLPVTSTGTVPVQSSLSETLVRYHPGQVAQGVYVEQRLGGAVVLQSDASVRPGSVVVDVGSDVVVTGAGAVGSATTATTATSAAPTTAPSTVPAGAPAPAGTFSSPARDALTPWDPRPCPASGG
ncbi:MAG: LCP family protein [Acidimicrobiales bacterium]